MNVVLVEDSIMIRAHMTTVLSKIGVNVVGHAGAEDDAVEMIMSRRPDVVLMDFSLELGNGLNVLKRIREAGSRTRVIMLSNHNTEYLRTLSIELGAHRYFDKGHELNKAITQIEDWLARPDIVIGAATT
jgi:DNA-binding NarL/FixJ family response regulator